MSAPVHYPRGGRTDPVPRRLLIAFLPLAALLALLATACQSTTKDPSTRAAFVVIQNQPRTAIEATTKTVFKTHGFDPEKAVGTNELVFIKRGTAMNSFFYGSWYDGAVWMRVKVYQQEIEPGRTLLDCDVYRVQEHDDPLFQTEQKLSGHRSAYQDLLDEVAKDVNSRAPIAVPAAPPATTPAP
jgi:hypothetical protein